jgi:hypothetical protein
MRCPVCKAENDQGPQCRRCRADLSLLFTLEEERSRLLDEASRCARAGCWRETAGLASQAEGLRGGEDARRLLVLAHLMERDYPAAWQAQKTLSRPG